VALMSLRSQVCPACYAQFEPRGNRPRCPVCGTRFDSRAASPSIEEVEDDPNLQSPDLLEPEIVEQEASALTWIGALVCLTAVAAVIIGAAIGSPVAFIGGFVAMFVVVAAFGIHNWWVKAKEMWRRDGGR
jgi:hypothetical protein